MLQDRQYLFQLLIQITVCVLSDYSHAISSPGRWVDAYLCQSLAPFACAWILPQIRGQVINIYTIFPSDVRRHIFSVEIYSVRHDASRTTGNGGRTSRPVPLQVFFSPTKDLTHSFYLEIHPYRSNKCSVPDFGRELLDSGSTNHRTQPLPGDWAYDIGEATIGYKWGDKDGNERGFLRILCFQTFTSILFLHGICYHTPPTTPFLCGSYDGT